MWNTKKNKKKVKKHNVRLKLELEPLFIMFLRLFLGLDQWGWHSFYFIFLQMSYKPIYTLNLNHPCSYPYPSKDLISYLNVKISIFFTSFKYYMTRFDNFEIWDHHIILDIYIFYKWYPWWYLVRISNFFEYMYNTSCLHMLKTFFHSHWHMFFY